MLKKVAAIKKNRNNKIPNLNGSNLKHLIGDSHKVVRVVLNKVRVNFRTILDVVHFCTRTSRTTH